MTGITESAEHEDAYGLDTKDGESTLSVKFDISKKHIDELVHIHGMTIEEAVDSTMNLVKRELVKDIKAGTKSRVMSVDVVLEQLENDPSSAAVMSAIKFFIPAIQRAGQEADDVFLNKFKQLVGVRNWSGVDALMWKWMTDDERDTLSYDALRKAQMTVDRLHLTERILKQVVFRVISYYLKI